MIAIDTNLLVYAHREDSEFHTKALAALRDLAESGRIWAIPWPCLHEFLAIVTHPKIYLPPTPVPLAIQALEVWIRSPGCRLISEGPGYLEILNGLITKGQAKGALIHDARIVALCLHHGVKSLWTADRDFSRFDGLRYINPLVQV